LTCAVGPAGYVEAATGLWIHEVVLVAPAPLLGAGTVAVPELNLCPSSSAAAYDIHTLAEDTKRPVTAVPRPVLCAWPVARPDLDRGATVRACTSVVEALATFAADWSSTPVLRLDDRRRVEAVPGID